MKNGRHDEGNKKNKCEGVRGFFFSIRVFFFFYFRFGGLFFYGVLTPLQIVHIYGLFFFFVVIKLYINKNKNKT